MSFKAPSLLLCRESEFDPTDLTHAAAADVTTSCVMSPSTSSGNLKAVVKGEEGHLLPPHLPPPMDFVPHPHVSMVDAERQASATCAPVEISPQMLRSVSAPCGKMATSPTTMDEHLRKNMDDRGWFVA